MVKLFLLFIDYIKGRGAILMKNGIHTRVEANFVILMLNIMGAQSHVERADINSSHKPGRIVYTVHLFNTSYFI